MGRGLLLSAVGLIAGAAAAIVLVRLTPVLASIAAFGAATIVALVAIVLVVAVASCLVPALRAPRSIPRTRCDTSNGSSLSGDPE